MKCRYSLMAERLPSKEYGIGSNPVGGAFFAHSH